MAKFSLFHGHYWALPVATALVWFATLVTLLGIWAKQGHRRYERKEPMPPFISDVGAANHKTFMGLAITTAGLYMITILTERWLRHQRRIPGSILRISTWYDWGCVFFTWLGCLGLIFLSIFDAFHHSTAHWSCTVLFIVGILLGVFFQCLEVYSLATSHRGQSRKVFSTLFIIASVKVAILVVAIVVAIAFACLYCRCRGDRYSTRHPNCSTSVNAASGCEWTVAFILFVYFFTHVADFWDARHRYNLDQYGNPVNDGEKAQTPHEPLSSDTGSHYNHADPAVAQPAPTQQAYYQAYAQPAAAGDPEYGANPQGAPYPTYTSAGAGAQPVAPVGAYAPPPGAPPVRHYVA